MAQMLGALLSHAYGGSPLRRPTVVSRRAPHSLGADATAPEPAHYSTRDPRLNRGLQDPVRPNARDPSC